MAHETDAAAAPYNARNDPESPLYRPRTRERARPVAGVLVQGIVLTWIVAPLVWWAVSNLASSLAFESGDEPTGLLVIGRLLAGAIAVFGFVRFLIAVHVLAARSDRAAAVEAGD